jgi:hypothetical protein
MSLTGALQEARSKRYRLPLPVALLVVDRTANGQGPVLHPVGHTGTTATVRDMVLKIEARRVLSAPGALMTVEVEVSTIAARLLTAMVHLGVTAVTASPHRTPETDATHLRTHLAMAALLTVDLLDTLTNMYRRIVMVTQHAPGRTEDPATQMTEFGMAAADPKTLVTLGKGIETTAQTVAAVSETETGLEIQGTLRVSDEMAEHAPEARNVVIGTVIGTVTSTGDRLDWGWARPLNKQHTRVVMFPFFRIGAEWFNAGGTALG